MTGAELIRVLARTGRGMLLRELAGTPQAEVVEHTRLVLEDLRERGLVRFSGQTDRWYLTPMGQGREQALPAGGQSENLDVLSESAPLTERVVHRLRTQGPALSRHLRSEFGVRDMTTVLMSLRARGLVYNEQGQWHAQQNPDGR
jgi:hypothetical protein